MRSSTPTRSSRAPRAAARPTPRPVRRVRWLLAAAVAALVLLLRPQLLAAWGEHGHRLIGGAAAAALPPEMPAFFRAAAPQLAYLNPEPDRWRGRPERDRDPALDGATAPDHFIDLELIPAERRAAVLALPDRFAYADTFRALGQDAAVVGVLPFRITELTQRLRVSFRRWRSESDPQTRAWIEQRIIDDAGILGHYVADGANPAHTTIHYNGWVGDNPKGYATDRRFHSRFESAFVQAQVTAPELRAALAAPSHARAQLYPDVRAGVLAYLQRTHALVDSLYALDRVAPFDSATTNPAHEAFVIDRLAAGSAMLRDLWWTAWVTSAPDSGAAPVRR